MWGAVAAKQVAAGVRDRPSEREKLAFSRHGCSIGRLVELSGMA
jgi:hypothetical protein